MAPNPTYMSENQCKKLSRIYPRSEGDEIVISGMSGRFPNCRNIAELEHNLYNKIDMVDEDERRWKHFNAEMPRRYGKLYDIEKFDATFFGVHFKQAHNMDPQCRILIECAYEAVLDAGVNPKLLRGSRTGVYIGAGFSETDKTLFYDKTSSGGFGITGCSRAMLANRISYVLGLNGPSYLIDTACSSSIHCLDNAFSAFRNGEIDAAIIGGSNLILHPNVTLQFAKLGVLSSDGYCRPFDQDACGYTRSETICCFFLQRKRDAYRIYANVLYTKINCDGYKEGGITYPAGNIQEKLLKEFYDDIKIDMNDIGYLEAHCNGTVSGTHEECRAVDNVICSKRNKPLPVGSIKSNIGHSEPASGASALAKIILAFQNGKIAPNIHFTKCPKDIPALAEGRLRVVSEVEKLNSPYVALNSFGFGGANSHVLLQAHSKEKENFGTPKDDLPRLINWAGRTEDSVSGILKAIETMPLDIELVALINKLQTDPIPGFVFRGFGLYSHSPGKNAECLGKEVQHFTGLQRPIVWIFSGMGSQWTQMGTSLMKIPIFQESINKCHNILKSRDLDLIKILSSDDPTTFDNILHSFVGIAAIQIAIVDLLRSLELKPDYIIGHSVGELGCAYADGAFTAEQMILSAYSRGKVSLEIEKIRGSMAVVGIGYLNIVDMLPCSIDVACHNSSTSCTISGPAEDVTKFVSELKSKGIFAKEVPCSNIAYHSRYISHMGPSLLKLLLEITPTPKKRSEKWLSSSVPKNKWDQPANQLCSAEYHTNNLLSSVLFEETVALLPENSLTIEIAPHGLLQAIIKKSMKNGIHVPLTQRENKQNANFFLSALGKLYLNGIDFKIENLYPPVEFPVSRGTASLSPFIKWDHKDEWLVVKFDAKTDGSGERIFKLDCSNENDRYLQGYIIDGRNIIPPMYYLQIVWQTYSFMHKDSSVSGMNIEFEDVKFIRPTPLLPDKEIEMIVMIHYASGDFEITQASEVIVTGIVRSIIKPQHPQAYKILKSNKQCPILKRNEFYRELRLRGYQFMDTFTSVIESRCDGIWGKVKWDSNWVSFLETLLQIQILSTDTRLLFLPTYIQKLKINGEYHMDLVAKMSLNNQYFEITFDHNLEKIVAGGVEIIGLKSTLLTKTKSTGVPVIEKYKFIPNILPTKLSKLNAVKICLQIAIENHSMQRIKIVEVDLDNLEPIVQYFRKSLGHLPSVTGDCMFLSKQQIESHGIHVENGALHTQSNCTFIISSMLLSRKEFIEKAQSSLLDNGYIVSREKPNFDIKNIHTPRNCNIINILHTDDETIVLMQCKKGQIELVQNKFLNIVKISQNNITCSWIEEIQNAITKGLVLLVSENEKFNGLLGMVHCLRKEPAGHNIFCIIIDDPKAPPFNIEHPLYKNQLKHGQAINIFKNGKWGTYRYLTLEKDVQERPHKDHVYASMSTLGDLSSFNWQQGPLQKSNETIKVVYSSLNSRDVMLATSRLLDIKSGNRLREHELFGFEFSGINIEGKRLMGMHDGFGAISSHINPDMTLVWEVPNNWNLREAATVPVAYLTVYWSYFFVVDITKGKSILIHSGSDGVGLAAIRVALAYKLDIFTTVDTPEKIKYLLQMFPQLKESHIGSSQNTSFELMVRTETNGRGVDFVLNTLDEDKLLTSIQCLATGGHLIEIGKFDIQNNNKMGIGVFLNELSFHAVIPDNLFNATKKTLDKLKMMIYKDISMGIVKPLPATVFKAHEIENAFRHIIREKHIGKVLLELRSNENSDETYSIKVTPKIHFNPESVFVITGDFESFGLELIDWLIIRGARKIVLNSTATILKSYQTYRIRTWEHYGVRILVKACDLINYQDCENLLRAAQKIGNVGGIFNLTKTVNDQLFINQTSQHFKECLALRATATKNLDNLSRKMCPQIEHFVVFSSIGSGLGVVGQTNYGMANCIMERIIEKRREDGLPAKAIQWGEIEKIDIIENICKDKDVVVSGEKCDVCQQKISSCLEKLDMLLLSVDTIVSSIILPKKLFNKNQKTNIIEKIMRILDIYDSTTISNTDTLSDIGLNPLMAMEVSKLLERELDIFMNLDSLLSLTWKKIIKLNVSGIANDSDMVKIKLAHENKQSLGVMLLWGNFGDEFNSENTILHLTKIHAIKLNSCLLVPGFEGVAGPIWNNIALNTRPNNFILQLTKTINMTSIEAISTAVIENIKSQVFNNSSEPFYIVGYSFGSLIALKLTKLLEDAGYNGRLILIDGAPVFFKKLCKSYMGNNINQHNIQIMLFTTIVQLLFTDENDNQVLSEFSSLISFEDKMIKFDEYLEKKNIYSKSYARLMIKALYNRIKILFDLDTEHFMKISSPIVLIRPSEVAVVDIDEDYELNKLTSGQVQVKFIEGNHTTILQNKKLLQIINDYDPAVELNKLFQNYINM